MTKVTMLYHDNSKCELKFTNKLSLNQIVAYVRINYRPNKSKNKSVIIQKYPLKDNNPMDYFSLEQVI